MDKKRCMDGTKLLWHFDRIIKHYDKGEKIAPIHIDVGLTKKCNIRCVYCYGYYQNMTGQIVEREALLDNLVTGASKAGVKSLAFIGDGEPTLNPACFVALVLGKKLGLSMAISTNGVLVDSDEKRASILESCEWMRFCLSAVSEEGYKKIHRSGHRDKVLDNIKKMVEYKNKHNLKCEIGLQMVFVPSMMLSEVTQEAKFAVETGVDYFVIKQCSLPDSGESGIEQFNLNDYEKPEVIEILTMAEMMSNEKTDIVPKWNTIALKGKKEYDHCVAVPLIWEISGDGGCYPCGYFFGNPKNDNVKLGNIHEKSIEEIVQNERYWDIINYMKNEFDVKKQCKGCCRLDPCNKFISDYLAKPKGINFI